MSDRLTLATATGLPLFVLAFHVAMGVVALAAGFVAITTRKGSWTTTGSRNRRSACECAREN